MEHNIAHRTELVSQLATMNIAEREIFGHGYYAASGILDSGDIIEMWIVQERMIGCQGRSSYVYLALNGVSNQRRYDLNGDTCDLADYLRGYHLGCAVRAATPLGSAGKRLLDGLYADLS